MTKGEKLCMMRELYEAGTSIDAIAETLGYKKTTVNQLLVQAGVRRKRPEGKVERQGKLILELRKGGMSIEDIAIELDVNKGAVSKYLREHGMGTYSKNVTTIKGEQPIDESKLVFVEEKPEKIERFFVSGKWYRTVSEREIYQH